MSACAAAASASGKVRWMTTLSFPCANSGQTFARSACASATLRACGEARSVEPVTVSRFIMTWRSSTSTRLPSRNAIWTSRPSGASERRLRST